MSQKLNPLTLLDAYLTAEPVLKAAEAHANLELLIEQVRELLEKAIPGPWKSSTDDNGWLGVHATSGREVCGLGDMEEMDTDDAWSAKLIAAAPQLARLCLDLHAQLQQERAGREQLRQLAQAAQMAESKYLDLEAIERHMVLPQSDWEAHSLAVDRAYSNAQMSAWLAVHAALAQARPTEPQP